MAMLGINEFEPADVDAMLGGYFADLVFGTDEDWINQLEIGGTNRRLKRGLIARVGDGNTYGRICLRPRNEPVKGVEWNLKRVVFETP